MQLLTSVLLVFAISEVQLDDGSPGSKESLFQENFGSQANLSSLCVRYPGQKITTGLKKRFIFSKNKVNWFRARELCETFGQEFAAITSAEEQRNFIDSYKASDVRASYVWIGGSDWAISNTFSWATLPPTTFAYANWAADEPNHKENEHCVYIHTRDSDFQGKWNDDKCHFGLEFACQTYE